MMKPGRHGTQREPSCERPPPGDRALPHCSAPRARRANGLYKRSLDISQKALGPDHPDVQTGLNNLASLNLEQGDWAAAAMYWRQSTDVLIRRSRRGNEALNGSLASRGKSESATERTSLWGLITATHRLAQTADGAQKMQLASDMLKTAQWAQAS